MTIRKQTEEIERKILHPRACLSSGSRGRIRPEKEVLVLSDFKTSNGIYPDQFIQLASYRIAIKEWLGLDVPALEVLRFGKEDGEFQTLMIDDPDEIQEFTNQAIRCRETYQFRKLENDKRFKFGGKNV